MVVLKSELHRTTAKTDRVNLEVRAAILFLRLLALVELSVQLFFSFIEINQSFSTSILLWQNCSSKLDENFEWFFIPSCSSNDQWWYVWIGRFDVDISASFMHHLNQLVVVQDCKVVDQTSPKTINQIKFLFYQIGFPLKFQCRDYLCCSIDHWFPFYLVKRLIL